MGIETTDGRRARYHHGDLKAALIEAATRIITRKRLEDFKVADAAREIGVSSGAPYRHFKDKDDLIAHVAAAGFEALSAHTQAAAQRHPQGSLESLIASGCAYVEFVSSRPELFHLMWGSVRRAEDGDAGEIPNQCYRIFLETLHGVMRAQGLGHLEPRAFAAPLWAMVHGFASLMMGNNPQAERDPAAVREHIDRATRAYFDGTRQAGLQVADP